MISPKSGHRAVALGLLGIAALGGVGIWQSFPKPVGRHITDCGFDATGAYAEVRLNNPVGAQDKAVRIDFYLDGRRYTYGLAHAHLPAHGRATTVVRGPFPRAGRNGVTGRTVYVEGEHHRRVEFVTRKFHEAHPGSTLAEVVPDARYTLTCEFTPPSPEPYD